MQVSYLHHRPTLTLHIFNARIFVLLVMAQLIRMLQSALHVRLLGICWLGQGRIQMDRECVTEQGYTETS